MASKIRPPGETSIVRMSPTFSKEEAALIDAARGPLPRSTFLRYLALSALSARTRTKDGAS